MKKKRKESLDEIPKSINEPELAYESRRVVFFKSFEEENEYTHKQRALTPPLEHFQAVTRMVKNNYQTELNQYPTLGNRIYFD